MPAPSPSFRFFMAYWKTGRALGATIAPRLEREFGLELRDYLALTTVHRGCHYPTELAERLSVPKDMASRVVHKLLDLGLLERAIDREDARRTRLELTEAGRAARAGVKQTIQDTVAPLLEELGEEESARLTASLGAFADLVERRLGDHA